MRSSEVRRFRRQFSSYGSRFFFSDISHPQKLRWPSNLHSNAPRLVKDQLPATSSSGARLAMSKVVKSKRKVCRECEDYQSLAEYERNVAERDELKKYD
jgi:hypothetical protein